LSDAQCIVTQRKQASKHASKEARLDPPIAREVRDAAALTHVTSLE